MVELGVFCRIQKASISLSVYLLNTLFDYPKPCMFDADGNFRNLVFLQLQGPSDNSVNLQTYVFRPSICEVTNCKFWASSSPGIR